MDNTTNIAIELPETELTQEDVQEFIDSLIDTDDDLDVFLSAVLEQVVSNLPKKNAINEDELSFGDVVYAGGHKAIFVFPNTPRPWAIEGTNRRRSTDELKEFGEISTEQQDERSESKDQQDSDEPISLFDLMQHARHTVMSALSNLMDESDEGDVEEGMDNPLAVIDCSRGVWTRTERGEYRNLRTDETLSLNDLDEKYGIMGGLASGTL